MTTSGLQDGKEPARMKLTIVDLVVFVTGFVMTMLLLICAHAHG